MSGAHPNRHIFLVATTMWTIASITTGCRDETVDPCKGSACNRPQSTDPSVPDSDSDERDTELPKDTESEEETDPLLVLLEDVDCSKVDTTVCDYYICSVALQGLSINTSDCTMIESYCAALTACYVDFTVCVKEICPPGMNVDTEHFPDSYDACSVDYELCMTAALNAI